MIQKVYLPAICEWPVKTRLAFLAFP